MHAAEKPAITDKPVEEIHVRASETLPEGLLSAAKPVVLRDYIADWPIVQRARHSNQDVLTYLQGFYNRKPVHLMQNGPEYCGRLFYNDDLSDFNFTRSQVDLISTMQDVLAQGDDPEAPTRYVGSTAVDQVLPGFRAENDVQALADKALVSIWMGNRSRVAAHYDAPDNIACVVAGKRRFTLFPPEQITNLYIGPLDFTPAGQPASLVDFHNPDYTRFPRFKQAVEHAVVAELGPGDALYVPSMWWHHVEGLSSFNVLVNYWWRQVENFVGVPGDALYHALLSIKPLPEPQRKAWRQFYEHYVFAPEEQAHIPESRIGVLGRMSATLSRQLRAILLNKLNR